MFYLMEFDRLRKMQQQQQQLSQGMGTRPVPTSDMLPSHLKVHHLNTCDKIIKETGTITTNRGSLTLCLPANSVLKFLTVMKEQVMSQSLLTFMKKLLNWLTLHTIDTIIINEASFFLYRFSSSWTWWISGRTRFSTGRVLNIPKHPPTISFFLIMKTKKKNHFFFSFY